MSGFDISDFHMQLGNGKFWLQYDLGTDSNSTFPSATSPAVPEFISGRYAENDTMQAAGAVHAFDREERRVVRYVTQPDAWQWPIPTLFESARELPAITVFEGGWDGPTAILTQLIS